MERKTGNNKKIKLDEIYDPQQVAKLKRLNSRLLEIEKYINNKLIGYSKQYNKRLAENGGNLYDYKVFVETEVYVRKTFYGMYRYGAYHASLISPFITPKPSFDPTDYGMGAEWSFIMCFLWNDPITLEITDIRFQFIESVTTHSCIAGKKLTL